MHPSLLSPTMSSLLAQLPGPDLTPAEGDASIVFARLRAAMAAFQEAPGSGERWQQFVAARREAAEAIAHLPRKEPQSYLVEDARQLVRELSASGLHDRRAEDDDLRLADAMRPKHWPGLLAAMLLTPAWRWPGAPMLLDVPGWLLGDFVKWTFTAPQGFSELGDADRYAAFTQSRLEELLRWVNRSPGVEAETEVLAAYATTASVIPLYFSSDALRRHAELRGKLLTRAFVMPNDRFDPVPTTRIGRRLRVGIVNRHFGPQTETYGTLPTFEELDPERFEVILFVLQTDNSVVEQYCRKRVSDFVTLPAEVDGQVATLRAAQLDVVVFGTNIGAVLHEIARIALHRVATLQVVNMSTCLTSGLPASDLYVSGTLTEAPGAEALYSERLGLMPGPAHAFSYHADRQEQQVFCSRAEFGIPEDAFVFVSGSNYYKIVPEMQHAWAKLLAAVPGSHLLVHPFNPNWSSDYPVLRFRAEFEQVLAAHGVEASRLAISTLRFPSRTDVKGLVGLGNVYLDTFPFAGVNSLVDPLELGIPVVTWEGGTLRSRMGAALLRQLQLPELIAHNADEYHAIALQFATDPALREQVSNAIRAKMDLAPLFLDMLAAGEAFGDVLEAAYDELVDKGRAAFRADRTPIMATPALPADGEAADPLQQAREVLKRSPADARARWALGKALLDLGRPGRASSYLIAALLGEEGDPELWFDVARALRGDGRPKEALQALEAGLKLNRLSLEGWVMFAEIAHAIGSADIAREAAEVARMIAPDDARLQAYL